MNKYHIKYSSTTKSLQALKKALTEIVDTGILTDDDILCIRYWMDDNIHLSGNYPFDKIYSIIDEILSDGVIEQEERQLLLSILQSEKICNPSPFELDSLAGCHVCLTGNFSFAKRSELEDLLTQHGAFNEKYINQKIDFIFVGGLGSNYWAYQNYGNKIKKAKEMQEHGHHILIFAEDVLKTFLETHIPPDTYTFEQCLGTIRNLPDEAQRILHSVINQIINGSHTFAYKYSETIGLLIENNILCKTTQEYDFHTILCLEPRNQLNVRIENLNLGIPFKKNMSLDDLINWCYENIPEHIKELFPDYIILKLHNLFLNPKVLVGLQQYFNNEFPDRAYY